MAIGAADARLEGTRTNLISASGKSTSVIGTVDAFAVKGLSGRFWWRVTVHEAYLIRILRLFCRRRPVIGTRRIVLFTCSYDCVDARAAANW
jgi:hypothetical protein